MNARTASRNTPKFRHAILMQLTMSWLTIYVKFSATSIFKLKPCDPFVVCYVGLIAFQFWLMMLQKWWSPRFVIPQRLKQKLLQAAEYTYKRRFD
jgi:hypothetical protein